MRYHITCEVTAAEGTQTFAVEAPDEATARRIFGTQGGEFVREEVNILDLNTEEFTVEEEQKT